LSINDVIIIGAGAAGSAAAFHLANSGKKVIVLEKNLDKFIKPCGGGMASSVQSLFPFKLNEVVEEIITRVEFTWCLSDPVIANLPGESPFWIVRRENLDAFLINNAISKGAQLIRPFKVNNLEKKDLTWIVTSEEGVELKSKALIIADGSNSPWTKLLKIGPKNIHQASTTSVRIEGRGLLEKGTSRFEFGLVHHGFAWAFPLKDSVNIGVGTFIGNRPADSKKVLELLLPDLGFNPKEGIRQSSSLRVWNGHSNLHSDGVVAVGDAASLCDPFLAEGLRPALLSGCEAAYSINNWLEGSTKDLSNYTKTMKNIWGESMSWGRRISQVFYRFPKIGYQLGVKRPTAPQRIAEILSGEMGYGDIANRVIKRLLLKR